MSETKKNDGYGLDVDARRAAEAREKEDKAKPEPLDPPFPFVAAGFDAGFFNVLLVGERPIP